MRAQTQVNQWRNTTEAISWFQSFRNKERKTFLTFDIVDFYTSISEQLLDKSIAWAKKKLFGKNVGLYRDDGLTVINTESGRLYDKTRNDLSHTFNELGLSIIALTNETSTDFPDVTFDLTNGTYKPYRKPNDKPLYINRSSNHPSPILRRTSSLN